MQKGLSNKVIKGYKSVKDIILRKMDWVSISKVGGSKFIQSFSIWIMLVPIIAKLFGNLPDIIEVRLFGSTFFFDIVLPFGLSIFYFSALSFGVANIIYLISCPQIIKNYENAGDFYNKRGSVSELSYYSKKINSNTYNSQFTKLSSSSNNSEQIKSDIFSGLVSDYKLNNTYIRAFVCFFYTMGFFLLALVIGQNTLSVIRV